MIRVQVKVFGPLRDIIRQNELALEVPGNGTGEAAFAALATQYPQLNAWRSSVRLAVNLNYVPFETRLKAGDEISFIPPVSGG